MAADPAPYLPDPGIGILRKGSSCLRRAIAEGLLELFGTHLEQHPLGGEAIQLGVRGHDLGIDLIIVRIEYIQANADRNAIAPQGRGQVLGRAVAEHRQGILRER